MSSAAQSQSLGIEEGEPAAKRLRHESEATSGGGGSSSAVPAPAAAAAPAPPPAPLALVAVAAPARGAAATTPRVARALVRYFAGKGMSKEDARGVLHEIFIRSVLLMGSRTGKLAEVVIVSRGAAAPMGLIMSFVDIPTRREAFEEEQTLVGHTSVVTCMTLLDDGRLVSGSDDMTLIVWAAGDDGAFAAAQTLSEHTSYVMCVTELDDRRLVSGSTDKTLKVWE